MQGLVRFHSPTEILFGFGAAEKLAEEAAALGVRRPLVVTDHGLVAAGFLQGVMADLDAEENGSAYAVRFGASDDDARAISETLQFGGCDGIVAFGGGSVLDAAKAGAVLAAAKSDSPAEFDCMAGGNDRMPPNLLPVIAVPTTAGTGSEVSPAAMVQLSNPPRKIMLLSRRLIPRAVICDPGIALDCPPWLAAGAGMDALSHAVEEYLSPRPHPAIDAVALEVVRRTARDLPELHQSPPESPRRRELTAEMMMSALMAGMGFEKGVGLVHCLSHPLSAMFGVHHGTANAVLLPAALRFQSAAVPSKMAALGVAFATAGLPTDPAAAVAELNRRLGIPTGLAAMGVKADGLAAAAKQALADPCRLTTPVRFRPADAERLYGESM